MLTITFHPQTQVIHITNLHKAASLVAHHHQPQQQWPRKLPRANGANGVATETKNCISTRGREIGMRRMANILRSLHQRKIKLGWMISAIIDHLRLFVFPLRIKRLEGEVPQKDPGRIIIMVSRLFPLRSVFNKTTIHQILSHRLVTNSLPCRTGQGCRSPLECRSHSECRKLLGGKIGKRLSSHLLGRLIWMRTTTMRIWEMQSEILQGRDKIMRVPMVLLVGRRVIIENFEAIAILPPINGFFFFCVQCGSECSEIFFWGFVE